MKEKLSEENCGHCAKVISAKARANLLDGRILCTACYNRACDKRRREEERIERETHAAQTAEAVAHEPPTERQLAFARELGIRIPAGATKWSLSELITQAVEARDSRRDDDEPHVRRVVYARPKRRSGFGCVTWAVIVGAVVVLAWVVVAMKR